MANVTFIPAKHKIGNNVSGDEVTKLRVAAYCRVSTDSDEQETSYDAQVSHYTEYIQQNPQWTLAGIFADDGISGTNTKKRDEFNRMIDECMAGNIDMIITKSISRFARNTLDCLQYIRQLKDKNIPVYFEKESINTMDAKGEVLITIMASLAQQESQSLSQNVKLGLQYRYQQGKVTVNCNRFLGYTKGNDGKLIIDPEQAEVVKRIYREYLEGSSMDKISAGLEADGILTGAGKEKWHTSTINKILRNEKYMGDALLQKTYTTDFLTKKRIRNNGTVPQYYVEDDHEAIIPKELFMQVQEELVRRRVVHKSPSGRKRTYSCNHCFAQIIVCGECGELYRRIHWNNHGRKSIVWRCISRLEPTDADMNCTNRTVNETVLEEVTVKALNQILSSRKVFLKQLQENIARAVVMTDTLSPDGIQARLEELQNELVKAVGNQKNYNALTDEILRLQKMKKDSEVDDHRRTETMNRIKELQDFIGKQETNITEFKETDVRMLIQKITVYEDKFTVEFKSGVSIDIEE
jgi:site-specific DNA recombinase